VDPTVTDCKYGMRHLPVVTYRRPWRRWWRKTYSLRCWTCDLRIEEPW
jgi:hypothetical protein